MTDENSASPAPVVDARASRVAQGLTALLVAVPLAARDWRLLAIPLAHLVSSLVIGKRGNLALVAFDAFLKGRLGPGELKDARPPRFANLVGSLFLIAAIGAHLAGLALLGWALAATVAILATLAATTGFCLGCRIYTLYRRAAPHLRHRSDPKRVG